MAAIPAGWDDEREVNVPQWNGWCRRIDPSLFVPAVAAASAVDYSFAAVVAAEMVFAVAHYYYCGRSTIAGHAIAPRWRSIVGWKIV